MPEVDAAGAWVPEDDAEGEGERGGTTLAGVAVGVCCAGVAPGVCCAGVAVGICSAGVAVGVCCASEALDPAFAGAFAIALHVHCVVAAPLKVLS